MHLRRQAVRSRRRFLPSILSVALTLLAPWGAPSWASPSTSAPSPLIAVAPLLPLTPGLPKGASGSIRDLVAAEISRRGARAKSGEKGVPLVFPDDVALSDQPSGEGMACPEEIAGALCVAAPGATDASAVAQICAAQSVKDSRAGRDESSVRHLEQALTLSPDRPLNWEAHSPRLHARAQAVREKFAQGSTSSLAIATASADVAILVDGRSVGAAPIVVTGLVPGIHHVSATSSALGQTKSFFCQVSPTPSDATSARLVLGTHPLHVLLDDMADGTLSPNAWQAARQIAADQGATHLFLGALDKNGDAIRLQSALVDLNAQRFAKLPQASFDPDLLTAVSEVVSLVSQGVLPSLTGDKFSPLSATDDLFDPVAHAPAVQVAFGQRIDQQSAPSDKTTTAPATDSIGQRPHRRPIDPRRPSGSLKDRR